MDTFVQQLINGLTIGAIYALIALGYTMVYGILRMHARRRVGYNINHIGFSSRDFSPDRNCAARAPSMTR